MNIAARAAAGALAGAFATYNMDVVGAAIYERQSEVVKDRDYRFSRLHWPYWE